MQRIFLSPWFLVCLLWTPFTFAQPEDCVTLSEWRKHANQSAILRRLVVEADDVFASEVPHSLIDDAIEQFVNIDLLEAGLSELKQAYHSGGYFRAALEPCLRSVKAGESNSVDLVVKVELGERAYVRNIDFVGVKSFPPHELEDVLASRKPSVMSQFLGTMGFGALDVEADKKRILEFYQARGYLDARVRGVHLQTSDNLDFCDLEFHIDEGKPYRVGQIEPKEWRSNVSIQEGAVFNLPLLNEEVERFLIPFKDQGFAFAKVKEELRVNNDLLSVRYDVDKGERIIIRSIIAKGNEFSADHVITREFRSLKGKLYNYSSVEIFRQRLLNRGGFASVKTSLVKTQTEGIYDLVVSVTEKFPMRFSLYPQYLTREGLLLSGYVLHQNILGLGVYGLVSMQISSQRQLYELAFYEPYLGDHSVSWLTEVHNRQFGHFSFTSYALGGGVRSGFRLNDNVSMGAALTVEDVSASVDVSPALFRPWVQIPKGQTKSAFSATASFQPLGTSTDANQQLAFDVRGTYSGAVSLSSFDFVEAAASVRWGFPLWRFVFRGRLAGAHLMKVGSSLLPITERYFLGGQYSLRGYQTLSVGPWVQTNASPASIQIGGVTKLLQTVEAEFPILSFIDMKGYLFTDMGNAYAESEGIFETGIAASIGFGVVANIWNFPVKFELAMPIVDMPGSLAPFDIFIGLSSVSL